MTRIGLFVAAALILALVGAPFGCLSNSEDDTQDSAIIEAMKKLPICCDQLFLADMDTLREDPFPLPDIQAFLALEEETSGELGLSIGELNYIGVSVGCMEVLLLLGDFSFDDVADELDNNDEYERNSYKGVDVWEDSGGGWMAFLPGCLIGGSRDAVTGCLRVIQDNEASFYDNNDLRTMVERLPDQTFMACGRFSPDKSPDDYGAASYGGASEHTVEVTLVQDFKDKDTVMERSQDVANFVAGLGQDLDPLEDFQITQDDRFIITTIEMDPSNAWSIGDMLNPN